jgi:hypothetical protein
LWNWGKLQKTSVTLVGAQPRYELGTPRNRVRSATTWAIFSSVQFRVIRNVHHFGISYCLHH